VIDVAFRRISQWLDEPVSTLRIEIVRVLAPPIVLAFMSARIAHVGEWIGDAGFRVPDLGDDWRQPLYVPALPMWAADTIGVLMVASGLAVMLGVRTRPSALVFAATLAFVALSDRLAAFTVSKLSPAIILAVALSPAGSRLGIDAYWKRRHGGKRPKKLKPVGATRFLQLLPVVMYSASGIAKARGDWLSVPLVLWSQLHSSLQTPIAFALATVLPAWTWTLFQGLVLAFEVFAPLWFGLRRTRPFALVFGLGMHAMIGLMFGPVIWFALLMMTLLVAGYLPERFLVPVEAVVKRWEKKPAAKKATVE
jgi:uncharacterized membrane protein YphA (DoxX/SURF4 family)